MQTPAKSTLPHSVHQGRAPATLGLDVIADASCRCDGVVADTPLAGVAFTRQLERERDTIAACLPRFDARGQLVEKSPGACTWAGLNDADRAQLFRAALEKLPTAHRILLQRAHSDGPGAQAVLRSARCRLAVHQALQALLYLARGIRDTQSAATPSAGG